MQDEPPQCANTVRGPHQNINLIRRLNILTETHRIIKACNVENCGKPVDRRGMCSTHYTRWKRHGDVNTVLRPWRPRINAANDEKLCTDCQTTKPVIHFHAHKDRADGLSEYCRECAVKRHHKVAPPAAPKQYPTVEPIHAAYLAGLFDGEGCINIYERRITTKRKVAPYGLRLYLTNTHRGVIEWMQTQFGGWVHVYRDRKRPKHWALGFKWHSSARHAAYLLEIMLPYLIIKKPEAELAIAFQKRVETYKYGIKLRRKGDPFISEKEDAIRAAMAQELRNLKQAYKEFERPE